VAQIDDLLEQVTDPILREQLRRSYDALASRRRYGLIYEKCDPEPSTEGPPEDRVSHTLRHLGAVERGTPGRPRHAVISGENLHALEIWLEDHEGRVDCVYIDPPYNTGARGWTYNNRYDGEADAWPHSRWLSMMESRLQLAGRLLSADGVLIVTIDEHEVHHLAMLLEQLFPDCRRQMVTIVNNAAGVSQGGFYRVEEYALFCFRGDSRPVPGADDMLSEQEKPTPLWFSHIRYGGTNDVPSKRPGLVYPIAIDPERLRIVGVGKTLSERIADGDIEVSGRSELDRWLPGPDESLDGHPVIWPFRKNGALATWQNQPETLLELAREGFVQVRSFPRGPGTNRWSVSYVKAGHRQKVHDGEIPILRREPDQGPYVLGEPRRDVVAKTVWKRSSHDAGKWGKRVLRELLGESPFDYPKSPYAVRDALAAVVGDDQDALIVDFFAGSGTTLHATMMLNAHDGGRRRCLMATDNPVPEPVAKVLRAGGHRPGDEPYERAGIFQAVTRPRIVAAVTGKSANGEVLAAHYLDGRPYADGYDETVDFFELEYGNREDAR